MNDWDPGKQGMTGFITLQGAERREIICEKFIVVLHRMT